MFKTWRLKREFGKAVTLEVDGQFAPARDIFKSISEQATGDLRAEALNRAGTCCTWLGEFAAARKLFQAARDADPKSPDYWLNFANACHRLGDGIGADEAYVEALKLAPNRPDILYYQSVYYVDKLTKAGLEGARRAMRYLLEMLEGGGELPGFPRELPLAFIRNVAIEKKLIEEGLTGLDEFVARPSKSPATAWVRAAALNHRGLLLSNAGRFDEAVKAYDEARKGPSSDDVLLNLGMAHMRRHDLEQARKSLTAYSKNHPTSPVTTYALALLAETKGDVPEAVRLYKFFLQRQAQTPAGVRDLMTLDIPRTWIDQAKTFTETVVKPGQGGYFEVPEGGETPSTDDEIPGASGGVSDRPRGT